MTSATQLTAALQALGPSPEPLHDLTFWPILDSCNLWSVAVRRPKSSLSAASLECLNRFRAIVNSGQSAVPVDITSIYNNAALFFYHNGRLECAADLTLDNLRLCSAAWKRTKNLAWCGCMLQPYTNLGRLAYAKNEFKRALGFFQDLYEYVWKAKSFQIGDSCFTPDLLGSFRDLKDEVGDLSLDGFAAAVYLAEGAKTFLASKDFDGLLDFVDSIISEFALTPAGASTVNASSSAVITGAQLNPDQQSLATLIVLELRARAFAGRGEEDKALAAYAAIVKRLPKLRPGIVGVYTSITKLLLNKNKRTEAQRLIDYASDLLKTFPDGPRLQLEHYQANFALASQYFSMGDMEKAQTHAKEAADHSRSCDHQAGKLRSQVLLLLSQFNEAGANTSSLNLDEQLQTCLELACDCLYPFERICALLELATGLNESSIHAAPLAQKAGQILQELKRQGGCLPTEFSVRIHALKLEQPSSSSGVFNDPVMECLYLSLRDYASRNGDTALNLPEFSPIQF
jgi:tetratricopeptide (TPR) repeat protein